MEIEASSDVMPLELSIFEKANNRLDTQFFFDTSYPLFN